MAMGKSGVVATDFTTAGILDALESIVASTGTLQANADKAISNDSLVSSINETALDWFITVVRVLVASRGSLTVEFKVWEIEPYTLTFEKKSSFPTDKSCGKQNVKYFSVSCGKYNLIFTADATLEDL
jgi:hypothetical protein